MPFVSYAQNFADVILWRALCNVENGFYVDIGAADPQIHLVTRAFYERGWSGINVEPLGENFSRLMQERPRDTNLKVAVGREAGIQSLYAFDIMTGWPQSIPRLVHGTKAQGFKVMKSSSQCYR